MGFPRGATAVVVASRDAGALVRASLLVRGVRVGVTWAGTSRGRFPLQAGVMSSCAARGASGTADQ